MRIAIQDYIKDSILYKTFKPYIITNQSLKIRKFIRYHVIVISGYKALKMKQYSQPN